MELEDLNNRLPKDIQDEYELQEKFIKQNNRISIKHIPCGKIYSTSFSKLFRDKGKCPLCIYNRHNTESFSKYVEDFTKGEYLLIGDYKGYCKKCDFLHTECNRIYSARPSDFILLNRCPKCQKELTSSYLEIEIDRFLCSYGIDYSREYRFNNCRNKNPLPFDFAVFKNGNLELLIEADGEQHFKSTSLFGGDVGFKKRIENDSIKNNFCEGNNIKLLRISSLKECSSILEKELGYLKVNYSECKNNYYKRINEELVEEVRKSYSKEIRGKEIMELHNINAQQLGDVINYRIFPNVRVDLKDAINTIKGKPLCGQKPKKLTDEQEEVIVKLFKEGTMKTHIAKQFKISTPLVLKTLRLYGFEKGTKQ